MVSEYTLRAARRVGDPWLIALEVRSLMRGAALNASNMENYSLLAQSTRVPGKLGGPVVDSPRQLWSVAGYIDMVVRGVFGLQNDGHVRPELPASLVPMLFGAGRRISLVMDGRKIVLERPPQAASPLLVAGSIRHLGSITDVELESGPARAAPPPMKAPMYLSRLPPAPLLRGAPGLAMVSSVAGPWPRHWRAPRHGEYLAWLRYANSNGPINTGITAAVKRLEVRCAGSAPQELPVVMPQSEGWQDSTTVRFRARGGQSCTFTMLRGFNMSDLARFALFDGNGGAAGPLDSARVGALRIAGLHASRPPPESAAAGP